MEINIIANRNCIVNFVNDFLASNQLIYFDCSNYENKGIIWGNVLDIKDFTDRDILINIGSKFDFEQKIKILSHRPLTEDKKDFIYMTNFWYPNEIKITDTSFIWNPQQSTHAKYNGIALKKIIRESFNQGMKTSDDRYNEFNKIFHKYYWSNEVDNYLDKLYYSGGIIPIQPISTKTVL
jgi:hypothetical protein